MTNRMSIAALAALLAIGSTQPLAAQRALRGPNVHTNSVKYSDAGAKPATGRSGSASLQARALYGRDGSVLVEATTGNLDGAAGPGQIRKMQMKVLSADGKPMSTQNFVGHGSYWTITGSDIALNGRVQLQANIGGIDGSRNDVVTVSVPVKRLPDVAVDGLTAPARAIAGTPVMLTATVSERNGDVGARANCMLSIDDQLTDQAHGIWVDAGHTVSCAFQATMPVGSHKVTVYANGVTPDDWDPTDNTASTSIDVLSPESPLAYSSTFNASDYDYYSHTKKSSADGSYLDETTTNGTRQNRSLAMTSTTDSTFAFPVQVRSALVADGSSVFDYTKDIALDPAQSTGNADCGVLMDGGYYLSVCNLRGNAPHSEVVLSSLGGRVTYFSSRFYQVDGADGYIINTSSDTPSGLGGYPVSSSVQSIIELRDARGMLFTARPTMSLQASPISTSYGSCALNRSTQVTTCSDGKTNGTSRTGSASAAGTQ
jgi:hypothetical protein